MPDGTLDVVGDSDSTGVGATDGARDSEGADVVGEKVDGW